MTLYPQKITFGEMRASGVRDVLVYCRDHDAATTSRSAPTAGPIMCSCRTSNAVSCARYAASAVPRCGRISAGAWAQTPTFPLNLSRSGATYV